MALHLVRKTIIMTLSILSFGTVSYPLFAQNLILDPGFEEYCKSWPVPSSIVKSRTWRICTNGERPKPRYAKSPVYNTLGDLNPSVYGTYQSPRSGNGFGVTIAYSKLGLTMPIYGKLSQPLHIDSLYYLEYWVNKDDSACVSTQHLDCVFLTKEKYGHSSLTGFKQENNTSAFYRKEYYWLPSPQFKNDIGIVSDTLNWVKISGFINPSEDGMEYIGIGNFENKNAMILEYSDSAMQNKLHPRYIARTNYFIDDVLIKPYGWQIVPKTNNNDNSMKDRIDYCLKNEIIFEVNTTKLHPASIYLLESIAKQLTKNPTQLVELCFTEYNEETDHLINPRYKNICNFLELRGVSLSQIRYTNVCDNRYKMFEFIEGQLNYLSGSVEFIWR